MYAQCMLHGTIAQFHYDSKPNFKRGESEKIRSKKLGERWKRIVNKNSELMVESLIKNGLRMSYEEKK